MTNIEILKKEYNNFCEMKFPTSSESELLDKIIDDNLLEFDGYFAGYISSFINNQGVIRNIDVLKKEADNIINLLKMNEKKITNKSDYKYIILYMEKIILIIEIYKRIIRHKGVET